jgi:hypothetical protein
MGGVESDAQSGVGPVFEEDKWVDRRGVDVLDAHES